MTTFTVISCLFVLSGVASALAIGFDLPRHPQSMRIMYSVWVLTGLWAGVPGLWAYYRFGRGPVKTPGTVPAEPNAAPHSGNGNMPTAANGMRNMPQNDASTTNSIPASAASARQKALSGVYPTQAMHAANSIQHDNMSGMLMPQRPHWQSVALSTLHCGAGCTLADLIGEWTLFFYPVALAGSFLAGSWVIDYLLALVLGVYFQYAAIRSMQRISRRRAVADALKADVLSLTAWQAGMYGWMALVIFVLRQGVMFPRTSWSFWFMMQLAMYCGFLLSLPMNVLLLRKKIKHAM